MKIGDKVKVTINTTKKDRESVKETETRKGYIYAVTSNLIVIMYTDMYGHDKYKESFNEGNIADKSVTIKTKDEELTVIGFREMRKVG